MTQPTEMELRVAKVIAKHTTCRYVADAYAACESARHAGHCDCFNAARAAIQAMQPDLETMDGHVMNRMCEAFHGECVGGGLTAACTRVVAAYLNAASPQREEQV